MKPPASRCGRSAPWPDRTNIAKSSMSPCECLCPTWSAVLNNGWATAMSTLSFERGTAALALLIGLTLKVEKLLAACPADRHECGCRLARLRAEGASIRATTYRFALNSENAVPDAGGSIIRLAFAEFAQRVTVGRRRPLRNRRARSRRHAWLGSRLSGRILRNDRGRRRRDSAQYHRRARSRAAEGTALEESP